MRVSFKMQHPLHPDGYLLVENELDDHAIAGLVAQKGRIQYIQDQVANLIYPMLRLYDDETYERPCERAAHMTRKP